MIYRYPFFAALCCGFLLSACTRQVVELTTPMIALRDVAILDNPGHGILLAEAAAGDTLQEHYTRVFPVVGKGQAAGRTAVYCYVSLGTTTGWVAAGLLGTFNDPRAARLAHLRTLPPAPKLYRFRRRKKHPTILENIAEGIASIYDTYLGDDATQTYRMVTEACQHDDPAVRAFTLGLIGKAEAGSFNLAQVCTIFDTINYRWVYANDPEKTEYYAPASETIDLELHGDCDDNAILMAAAIRAIGGAVRINFVRTETGGHAFTEVHLGDKKTAVASAKYLAARYGLSTRVAGRGIAEYDGRFWLNLDWFEDYPGGAYYERETVMVIQP